jgi:hypothetical protein
MTESSRPSRARGARSLAAPALLALLAVAPACSRQNAVSGVQGPEEGDFEPLALGASSVQRFGGMPGARPSAPTAAAPAESASAYHYELPEGWSEAPPKMLRDVNLLVPGGAECWLTRMGPGAGGLEANLDRWRGQLGLGPASADEVAALPRQPFLDEEAIRVDLVSTDGSTRMVGLMQFLPDRSIFLRISGPADVVGEHLDGFSDLARTLHSGAGHSHGDAGASGGEPAAAAAGGGAAGAGGLRWVAPDGWQPLEPDAFRLAWYQIGPDVQSWITTLGGTGGGVEANLSRWHSQFDRPAPGADDIAALPTVSVLGRDALWVDLLGEGEADGMIGVLCALPAQTVFLKIQGPSDAVREQVADFRAFCESLALQ